jgi:drug/metabolite transporter (DMT)-like permease
MRTLQPQPAGAAVPVPPAPAAVSAVPTNRPVAMKIILGIAGAAVYGLILVHALFSGDRVVSWLALLSLNVFGTAGFNLLIKRTAWTQLDQWLTAAILQTGLFIPFLIKEAAMPIKFPTFTSFDLLLLAIAACGLISLQYFNVKALEHLEASVFSVVYNTRIIFITLLGGLFLAESIGLLALLGGGLIFLAIFIVRQKSERRITATGIGFGLAAALAMSTMNTCEKELIKLVGYQQYIFPLFAVACIILWAIVFIRRTAVPINLIMTPTSLGLMALRACAGIGFSYSLVFGPVAVSSYISSLSVVALVIFGILFLNEGDYLRSKVVAVATATVGLTMILIDSL